MNTQRELYYYHEIEDDTEELLNEIYSSTTICGYAYHQGTALKTLDPIAFREIVLERINSDYETLEFSDLTEEEIERLGCTERNTLYTPEIED
jgi:hypothetical protein